jgi:hypothetical protein
MLAQEQHGTRDTNRDTFQILQCHHLFHQLSSSFTPRNTPRSTAAAQLYIF